MSKKIHPAINSVPPNGVINAILLKSIVVKLLVASKYIEPEKQITPNKSRKKIGF
jgi:hypothetical protein